MDNFFDETIKERARQEPFPLPPDYTDRVLATCAGLQDAAVETRHRAAKRHAYRWVGWAAAVLALFIAVPNVSPAAAAAMREVPVLGAIVEIITFRDYTYDDGHSAAEVTVPELGGSGAAGQVNEQVRAYTDQLIAQFEKERDTIGEGYQGLDVESRVVCNTDAWFTLRIDAVQTQASGYSFSKLYHINKATGEQVTLSGLFGADADYVSVLSAEVKRQMTERLAADDTQGYLLEEFTAIDPEQNFYWNEKGELVLVFDEYTVAVGAMGTPEFPISTDVTEGLLK